MIMYLVKLEYLMPWPVVLKIYLNKNAILSIILDSLNLQKADQLHATWNYLYNLSSFE